MWGQGGWGESGWNEEPNDKQVSTPQPQGETTEQQDKQEE
jgi:hypothetical protein